MSTSKKFHRLQRDLNQGPMFRHGISCYRALPFELFKLMRLGLRHRIVDDSDFKSANFDRRFQSNSRLELFATEKHVTFKCIDGSSASSRCRVVKLVNPILEVTEEIKFDSHFFIFIELIVLVGYRLTIQRFLII